jgi:thymidylate synthase (FAD)
MLFNTKVTSYTVPAEDVDAEGSEALVAYCARISSGRPKSTWGEDYEGLLKYCVRNSHWSVFEMVDATVEIEGPRDILRQILRHRSFSFQEFSQRYSDDIKFTTRGARLQDAKNRQNSFDDMRQQDKNEFIRDCESLIYEAQRLYKYWVSQGVAKECARVFLPEGLTMSTMQMKGSLRSWLHYLAVRDDEGVTQLEHVLIARAIRDVLVPHFPTILGLKT